MNAPNPRPGPLARGSLGPQPWFVVSIHDPMNRLQRHGAPGHDQGAGGKHHDPPPGRQRFEERIGIPAVLPVALFDPEPVREGNGAAEQRGARKSDGPRGGEEEEVEGQGGGWYEVESEV
ncbi:hypothetical protein MMC22_003166 [Lobaria immixta]|nr:hypothetical protein [Lobaria immixta]